MTGYEIEHNLEQRIRNWSLDPIEQLLYLKLKIIANEMGLLAQKFKVSNAELQFRVGISKAKLCSARDNLIKSGLLGYRSGGKDGSKKTFGEYWFIDLRYTTKTTNDTTVNTTTCTTNDTTSYTLIKTKTKRKEKYKKEKTSYGDEKIISSDFFDILSADTLWMETICMNKHFTPTEFKDKLILFFAECTEKEKEHPSEKEYKNHFINWLVYKSDALNKKNHEEKQPAGAVIDIHPLV